MDRMISVAAATALGVGLMASSPGAQAAPARSALPNVDALASSVPNAEYSQYRSRRHGHYRSRRGYRNAAGAAAAVGIAGALIGGAIAAQNSRRDYYYEQPHYGVYGGPAYGYYDPYD